MKAVKFAVLALALVTGAVQAELKGYGSFEYYDETNRATQADNYKIGTVIGVKNSEGWDFSGKAAMGQAELGNGNISSDIELRIRKNWKNGLGFFSPWAGVRAGEAIKKDDNWVYYAVEGGLKFPIAGTLSGDVGYRYKNATEQWREQESHRAHFMISHALTKQDSVGVRYSRSYGDEEKNSWRLSYTRSF